MAYNFAPHNHDKTTKYTIKNVAGEMRLYSCCAIVANPGLNQSCYVGKVYRNEINKLTEYCPVAQSMVAKGAAAPRQECNIRNNAKTQTNI